MRRTLSLLLASLATSGGISLEGCAAPAAKPQWGFALEGNPITGEQLAAVTRATGLAPRLVVFFQQWPENPAARDFPQASLDAIAGAGAEPVLTWEPMYYRRQDGAETMVAATRITGGEYDGYLDAFAQQAARWGRPLLVRFAHEMNLARYHWGTAAADYGPRSPEAYRAMWRHVVGIFRRAGATNVRWAFCPNVESVPGPGNAPNAAWNVASAFYPGGDWVDVVGIDGYNWGTTQTVARHGWQSSWRGVADTFGRARGELQTLAPGKPVFVFETASAADGGEKAAWLSELARVAVDWKLAGVVWFHANKEVDWRLTTGVKPAALAPLRENFSTAR